VRHRLSHTGAAHVLAALPIGLIERMSDLNESVQAMQADESATGVDSGAGTGDEELRCLANDAYATLAATSSVVMQRRGVGMANKKAPRNKKRASGAKKGKKQKQGDCKSGSHIHTYVHTYMHILNSYIHHLFVFGHVVIYV
jgi:hypothetical protein